MATRQYVSWIVVNTGIVPTVTSPTINGVSAALDSVSIRNSSPQTPDGTKDVYVVAITGDGATSATGGISVTTSNGSGWNWSDTDPGNMGLWYNSGDSATKSISAPNNAPAPSQSSLALTLMAGATVALKASDYFSDADGDVISYTLAGADAVQFSVSSVSSDVSFSSPATVGNYSFDVVGSDVNGDSGSMSVSVSVIAATPITWAENDFSADASALPAGFPLYFTVDNGVTPTQVSFTAMNADTSAVITTNLADATFNQVDSHVSGDLWVVYLDQALAGGATNVTVYAGIQTSDSSQFRNHGSVRPAIPYTGGTLENTNAAVNATSELVAIGNLVVNTAALIAQSGSANTELHAVGVHNIQHVDGITLTHGNNTITLFEDNSTMRTGSNLDNDTYASVSDFTLTVPAGGAVRIYWAEITA